MEDITGRPRAVRTLVNLAEMKEPYTMRDFMRASDYVWETAAELLAELEGDGLLKVGTAKEGSIRSKEIRMTDEAREIAKLGLKQRELHKKARERKLREK